VSPFSPFLFPPASVFSRSSLLLATHRPLPTLPRPLFSYSYKSLLPQPLYLHIHTKPPGCGRVSAPYLATRHSPLATFPVFSSACRLLVSLGSLFRPRSLCFQYVAASFRKMPGWGGYPERLYGTPGVGVPSIDQQRLLAIPPTFSASVSRCAWLPRPGRGVKPRPCVLRRGAPKLSTVNCRLLTAPLCLGVVACPDLVGVAIQSGRTGGGTARPQAPLESTLAKVYQNK
jgi:hypothetical protein